MPKTVVGLLAMACALSIVGGCSSDKDAVAQQPLPSGTFGHQLDAAAAKAGAEGEGMACRARAFGFSPASARSMPQVKKIYAWILCGGVIVQPVMSGSEVQVAVSMSTPPVAAEPPDDTGPGDPEFDRLFPPDVLTWAGSTPPSDAWFRAN